MNKNEILAQMSGKSITNGWDVVCAMSADHITSLFQDKYDKEKNDPCPSSGIRKSGLPCRIKLDYTDTGNKIHVDVCVGPPLFSFIPDDPKTCKMQLEITQGVYTATSVLEPAPLPGTVAVSQDSLDQVVGSGTKFTAMAPAGFLISIGTEVIKIKSVTDDTHLTVESNFQQAYSNQGYEIYAGYEKIPASPSDTNKYYITAHIPLAGLQGTIKQEGGDVTKHDIVVDFDDDKGRYEIDIGSSKLKPGLSEALRVYFKKNLSKGDFSLGTLAYKENPDLITLTPNTDFKNHAFRFATGVEQNESTDTGCLMLFITTQWAESADAVDGTELNLSGIVNPIPDDHSAAIILSSRLLFKQILLPQYQHKFGSGTQAQCTGSSVVDIWKLVGAASDSLDCGSIDDDQKQDVKIPMRSFFVFPADLGITVSWDTSWDQPIQYWRNVYVEGDVESILEDGDVKMSIKTTGSTCVLSVDANDVITCATSSSFEVSCVKPNKWVTPYQMTNASTGAKSKANEKVGNIKIDLEGVSVFVVSNLLFPEDHIITYDEHGVYVPGDLVIFGTTKQNL